MNTRWSASLLAAAAITMGAAPAFGQGLPAGVTQAMIDQGNKVYHGPGLCFACHGPEGKGGIGPDLTDSVWIHSKGTYDEIVKQVTTGVTLEQSTTNPKVAMPPKGGSAITDDDVKAVSAFVWSLSHAKK
jgi:mono/diheme cytochrome c family protein